MVWKNKNFRLKEKGLFTFVLLFAVIMANGQQTVSFMTYNVLNFSESSTNRLPYLKMVIDSTQPDILVIQEVLTQGGIDVFYSSVLSAEYGKGTFIDGPDSDNGLFYKHELFAFISNIPISTALRDISEFTLKHNLTGDTVRVYSVHLKASSGSTNENKRLQEIVLLREVTNALPIGSNFIICGDFNIYKSSEPAYQELLNDNGSGDGYFIDPIDMTGTWNNSGYAQYHTQSPRTRQFGGGANGGLDDRFDLILFSKAIADPGGMDYVANSTWAVGNDGFHYNDSINAPPNASVSQGFADALHYGSDHLPVVAKFSLDATSSSQEIILKKGWNGISSYIQPDNTNLVTLLEPINNEFLILQNDNGMYYPGSNVETIQNWNYKSGYAIKVNNPVTFEINGQIPVDRSMQISEGWNMLPILSDHPVYLEELFYSNLSNIQIVKEIAGYSIYWPEMNIKNLTVLMPGKAYSLKSTGDFEVEF